MGVKIDFETELLKNQSSEFIKENLDEDTLDSAEAQHYRSATNLALRFLSQRSHTRRELSLKLLSRGFDGKITEQVLAECERLGYVNDAALARSYIKQMAEKGYGARYVKQAMKKKGFADRHIGASFSDYDFAADEKDVAEKALKKKLKTLDRFPDELKKKEKLFRFLSSRGFSPSTIFEVLDKALIDIREKK